MDDQSNFVGTTDPARVAFLIISDDPERAIPGMVMAARMKSNRNADVRLLFFGPGTRLAASGKVDEQLDTLHSVGILSKVCTANVDQFGLAAEIAARPVELVAAGAEVEEFARKGYTVLSF